MSQVHDSAEALLANGRHAAALAALEPRARDGDDAARRLLVRLATHPQADLRAVRLPAGDLLNQVGDPRYEGDGWMPELVAVPAGPFLMGSTHHEPALTNETPQHRLHLPDYWIGRTTVTNAQWRRFMDAGGYTTERYWPRAGWYKRPKAGRPAFWDRPDLNGANQPVMGVSWYEAVAYCRWLSEAAGQTFYLPCEAEWEKAARGPHGLTYPWGNAWQPGRCNSRELALGRTTPAGSFPAGASPYGALDMAGNIWEWCATKKGVGSTIYPDQRKSYPYDADEDEWALSYVESSNARRIRGGSYHSVAFDVRCAKRAYIERPEIACCATGLRVASRAPRPGALA